MKNEKTEQVDYEAEIDVFELSSTDDAIHISSSPVSYEWWYFDASFDNGYSMASLWKLSSAQTGSINSKEHLVDFSIYDPSAKKTMVKKIFSEKEVSISSEKCDAHMGKNRIYGKAPAYHMHFHEDRLGGDLLFESMVQGFRSPPDGTTYFNDEPPLYVGWSIAQPRANVTGTLHLDGHDITVNGTGYHDHNWGNSSINEVYDNWYWGRLFLPGHTFIYSVGLSSASLGSFEVPVLISFEGSKLLDLSTGITAEPDLFETDEITGIAYPKELVLKVDTGLISGRITHRLRKLIESYPLPEGYPLLGQETLVNGHGAVRFLSDCSVDLVVNSENIRLDTPLIHEYMQP